jgi:hypothetical protein
MSVRQKLRAAAARVEALVDAYTSNKPKAVVSACLARLETADQAMGACQLRSSFTADEQELLAAVFRGLCTLAEHDSDFQKPSWMEVVYRVHTTILHVCKALEGSSRGEDDLHDWLVPQGELWVGGGTGGSLRPSAGTSMQLNVVTARPQMQQAGSPCPAGKLPALPPAT